METASSPVAFAIYLILYLALTLLFTIGILSAVSRYCRLSLSNFNPANSTPTTTVVVGLDTSIIETFPKFAYTTNANMGVGEKMRKMTSECGVCLGVFELAEMLRLLPICGHVFHADCIDSWLRTHATCPYCRANLLTSDNNHQGEVIIDVCHQPPLNRVVG